MAIALTGPAVGKPAEIIAKIAAAGGLRMDEVGRYVAELYRLAPLATLNADALVSQWSEETGKGTSAAWRDRLNGAGIGITGPLGGGGTDYGYSFASGTDFARCHCVHMAAYVFGSCPAALKPYQSLDPRWQAVFDAGYAGTAKTVDDLSNRWADDPQYGQKIAQHYQWLFGALPAATGSGGSSVPSLNMTKGLIQLPPYTRHIINVSKRNQSIDCRGYDDLGPRTVNGLVLHRSLGTYQSNINWYDAVCCPALTDWQIDADTGEVMQFVPIASRVSGWASGRVIAPWGDGKAFVAKYGIDAVNRDQQSIEITKNYDDPVSEKAWQNLAQWGAYFAHEKGITYLDWPIVPVDGFSWVRWHQEFTGPQEKICPGPVVMDGTDQWIERVRGILKAAQTSGATAPVPSAPAPKSYVIPAVPQGLPNLRTLDADTALPDYKDAEGRDYETVFDIYEATVDTYRYQRATGDPRDIINDPFPAKGRAVIAVRFDSGTTHDKWGLTREGTRLWLKDFRRVGDASSLT